MDFSAQEAELTIRQVLEGVRPAADVDLGEELALVAAADPDRAASLASEMHTARVGTDVAALHMAALALGAGDRDAAIVRLEEALQETPGHAFLLLRLALLTLQARPVDAAELANQAIEAGLASDSMIAEAHVIRGIALTRTQRFRDATCALRTAYSLNPSTPGLGSALVAAYLGRAGWLISVVVLLSAVFAVVDDGLLGSIMAGVTIAICAPVSMLLLRGGRALLAGLPILLLIAALLGHLLAAPVLSG